MLVNNMSLSQMLNFKPSDEEMLMLPLDVVVYIKVNVISMDQATNYDFLRSFFQKEEIHNFLKEAHKSIFYDFDATHTEQHKFITIFELFATKNVLQCEDELIELLQDYNHDADLIFDLFTHDNKIYRISNLDGIIKSEALHPLN